MSADAALVIDAGTSAMRAVLVDAVGGVTPLGREEWRILAPPDASMFAREFNPREVEASLRSLLSEAESVRGRVAGIAVTGQRQGLVALDGGGQAVFAAPNIDGRASAEGMAIDAAHGARVYAVTGHLPSLMQAPAKLAWLRANRPDVARAIRTVLPFVDWIAMLMTREPAMSRTLGVENGLLEVGSGEPATALLESLGFDRSLLPAARPEGTVSGVVRGGPFAGVPVALAGADTQCALVGVGVVDEGAGVAAGWSAPVQRVVAAPTHDAAARVWAGLHVAPGRWVIESNAGECGRAWEWAASIAGVSVGEAERLAAASPPGSRDVLSVLGPRAMDASHMSAGIGAITLPLPLVMAAPDRGDVLRSVLESVAYAIRANLAQIDDVVGAASPALALGGGMSRSPLFGQMLADVIDRPVTVARAPETSALGAAVVASPGLGLHDTIASAVAAMTLPARFIEPRAPTAAVYEDAYARWCALAEGLASERW